MSSLTSRQWFAIAVGVIFFALLFLVNRKMPATATADSGHATPNSAPAKSFDDILKESEATISQSDKPLVGNLLAKLDVTTDSTHARLLFRLASVYDSIGQPLAASYYREELAKMEKSAGIWYKVGERYLDIAELVNQTDRDVIVSRAEDCFNNCLKVDSNYLDAKVGLGSCFVERGNNPMKGIGMIMEVINKDSNNFNAQLALGKFSIKSAQYEKAVSRFKKVLTINPTFYEGYLYLAQAYEGLGNKKDAIVYLKKYTALSSDTALKREINKHIEELK